MFSGEYNHTIDSKGRITIPSKFRNLLGDAFEITRSFDGCLAIYDKETFQVLVKKLNDLPMSDGRSRFLKRFLTGSNKTLTFDKMGRSLIPIELRNYAHLDFNVVLVGIGDHIELWDKEMWDKNNDFSDYEKISKNIEGLGI